MLLNDSYLQLEISREIMKLEEQVKVIVGAAHSAFSNDIFFVSSTNSQSMSCSSFCKSITQWAWSVFFENFLLLIE